MQQWPKEGILSRAKPSTPSKPPETRTSRASPALKPSYSQVVKTTGLARDPGKGHVTNPHMTRSHTYARDPGKPHVTRNGHMVKNEHMTKTPQGR